jgi:hypothetical protein
MKRMKIVIVLVVIFVYSVSINARNMGDQPGRVPQGRGPAQSVKPLSKDAAQKHLLESLEWGIDDEEEEEGIEQGPQEPLRVYAKRKFDEKYKDVQEELAKIRKRVFGDKITVADAISEIKRNNKELVTMQKDFKKAIELEEDSGETEEFTGYLASGVKGAFNKIKSVFVYSDEEKEIALWMIDQLEHQKKEYTTYYANLLGRSAGSTIPKQIYKAIMQGLDDEINKQKVIAGKLWSTNQKYALSAAGALATLGTIGYSVSGKKVEPPKGGLSNVESGNQPDKVLNIKPEDNTAKVPENKPKSKGWFSGWFGSSDQSDLAKAKKDAEEKTKDLLAAQKREELAKQKLEKEQAKEKTLSNQQALDAPIKLIKEKEETDRKLKEAEEKEEAVRKAMQKDEEEKEKAKIQAAAKAKADKIAAEQKKLDDKIQSLKRQAEGELVKAKNAIDPLIKSTAAEWAEIFTKQAKDIEEYSSLYNKFKIPGHKLTPQDRTRLAELTDAIRSY